MHIIITWEIALLIIVAYFVTKYLFDTFLKLVAGCRDPFNPLYGYHDYPAWTKGYNRGRQQILKIVRNMLTEANAELEAYTKKLEKLQEDKKADTGKQ